MKDERDYIQDIAEIRSMMERSTKFLSLSGWAGIMAGIYALIGAWIAYNHYQFNPKTIVYASTALPKVMVLAVIVLILAIATAIALSYQKARTQHKKAWNATSRQLLLNMAVPLFAGGILILMLWSRGFAGLMAPLTLLFYGIAIYNASTFTYSDMKFMGVLQIILGLVGVWFIEYSLLFWAIGFGLVHIGYGIYMYFRYER